MILTHLDIPECRREQIWTDRKGKKTPVKDLKSEHIVNILKAGSIINRTMLQTLTTELVLRSLIKSFSNDQELGEHIKKLINEV